ncbi:hypothetical protein DPEC_G00377280 [Dallia pectoralis]|nr:hypothetical protein DPEC_G00377280 [Dallia pectoralis]
MALEELEIRDLDQVTRIYAALLSAHVRLLKLLMPRVMWKEVPVVVVFEQNTYMNALADVKKLIEHSLARSGFKVLFYSKWSHVNNKYMLGKHVSAKTKLAMVLSTVLAIDRETLRYCDTVMSLGWAVLAEATQKMRTIESNIGTPKGAGSSNRMGSNMDVFMLTDKAHAEQGKQLLGKLREEMATVTITESAKGSMVSTGGKRSVHGEYTRDDMLSALLLLCHTRDEIHSGDKSIRLSGEVYYK